jgi:RNA polymerase sigma factor (sigma-70 family)
MQPKSDAQLLREYAESGSESAFTELVARHTDLVYSAALRQVPSSDLACDIAQNVFTSLARGARTLAGKLNPDASLAGWLCRCTRNLALNLRRDDFRRHSRERQAMETLHPSPETAPDWDRLCPMLDEAISGLNEADHDALVLRYFKNQDLRSVGLALGVSDDTAQKRVSRAVERLREFFSKRNVTIGASGLTVVIAANAVQAAPTGLAAAISAAALAGTAVSTSTIITATKTIAMTTLQKTVIGAALVAAVGAGIYEAHQASTLRTQVQTLQRQELPLTEQMQQLQRERDEATNRLAAVSNEIARLRSGQPLMALLKLRGQVGLLQQLALSNLQSNSATSILAGLMNDPAQKKLDQIQAQEAAKDKYSSLVKTLQLSPEDKEIFFDLISGNEIRKKDMISALISGNLDAATAMQQRDAAKTEMENQIKTLLGDSGYAQYDKFNRDSFAEDRLNALNRELGSNAFNDEQRKQIKAVFAATSPIPLEDIDAFRPKESMDALFQQWTDQYHSELQQAAQFLTPDQSAAAFVCQSNIFNRIQNQIDLSQELLNKLAWLHAQ